MKCMYWKDEEFKMKDFVFANVKDSDGGLLQVEPLGF